MRCRSSTHVTCRTSSLSWVFSYPSPLFDFLLCSASRTLRHLPLLPPSSPCAMLTADNTVIHKFSCSAKSRWQQHSKPLKGVENLKRVTNFGLFRMFRGMALLRQDSAPIALPLCIASWL